jgi:hypothetical protein
VRVEKVKERDKWCCQKCNAKTKLHAHHIIPWEQDKSKRFDLDNGITLCASCHAKEDLTGKKRPPEVCKNISEGHKGQVSYWKGKKLSEEHKRKLSDAKKGKAPWNKGKINNPEKKICKDCNIEKPVKDFTPQGNWYTNRCKKCRNAILKQKREAQLGN